MSDITTETERRRHASNKKFAAHMLASMKDYDHDHACQGCGRPVRITVRHPASVTHVLHHWHTRLGAKCKECIDKHKETP